MRGWAPLLLLVVTTAGCLWLAEEDAGPEEAAEWHLSSEVVGREGFCGDCHYGMEEMWNADWAMDGDEWELTVSPRFAEAPLYAVQVGDDPVVDENGWQVAEVAVGDTFTTAFQVAEEADHVLVKAYGSGPQNDALTLTSNQADVVETALTIIDPDGTRYEAEGPEEDLRIVTATAVPGSWTAQVTLVAAETPSGSLHVHFEELRGNVTPMLAWGEEAVFRFPANESDAPPATTLRVQPHHDHALFQNDEWDPYDSTPFLVTYTPVPGPWPEPKVWNQTEIDALWDGRGEYRFHSFSGSFQDVYVDEPGHNDPGIGSGYPGFGSPDGDPVLPGTGSVRLELTWNPPTDEPDLWIKMSPADWPYFLYPEATVREPGRAVFDVSIQPMWWEDPEQTLEWYEPGVVRSYYDIAPFIAEDGEPHAEVIDWTVEAFAVRGN